MIKIININEGYDNEGVWIRSTDLADIIDNITDDDYVLKIKSLRTLDVSSGSLLIDFDCISDDSDQIPDGVQLTVAVKWGQRYLQPDLKTWSSTFACVSIVKNDNPTEIKITQYYSGELQVMIMPFVLRSDRAVWSSYIITNLSLEYNLEKSIE